MAVPRSVKTSKHGCPKCGVAKGKIDNSLQYFLKKYDSSLYDLVEFKNCMEVTVRCKKCGTLRTTNANNIYRFGCANCAHKRISDSQRLTQEEFIKRAKEVHNDKYNYNKVEYINWTTPVIITCPTHGNFAQMPGKHISGQGCPKCTGKNKTTKEWIEEAKKIHNDIYDYSKSEYKGITTPITIICKTHGEFQQLPYVHAKMGCGCPKCQQSHGERLVSNILKKLEIDFKEQILINNPYNEGHKFRLDFWIPKYNSIIEYNGKQHYIPVERFGGELQFNQQIRRDTDLRKYCSEHNINLLEIKYNEKDIKNLIKNFLNL